MRTFSNIGIQSIKQQVPCPVDSKGDAIIFIKSLGAKLYDINGKEYIDLQNGKGAVIIGHNDTSINNNIIQFLTNNFDVKSGFHPLIYKVAEQIQANLKYESIAFFKTGTEAVRAAVTAVCRQSNKSIILSSGYHGYSTFWERSNEIFYPNKWGVIDFYYNLDTLKKLIITYKNKVAGIVISPDRLHFTESWFNDALEIIQESGIPIISDEVKAGYRYHAGLMVEQFGWRPNVAVVSKGIANGYPLSAVVGPANVINMVASHSYTAFFDPISYLTANVVLDTLQNKAVYKKLEDLTNLLTGKIKNIFNIYNLPIHILQYKSFFQFVIGDKSLENSFYNYSLEKGIIFYTKDNQVLSLAFSEQIIEELEEKIEQVAKRLTKDFGIQKLEPIKTEHYLEAAWYLIDGLPGLPLSHNEAKEKLLYLRDILYV